MSTTNLDAYQISMDKLGYALVAIETPNINKCHDCSCDSPVMAIMCSDGTVAEIATAATEAKPAFFCLQCIDTRVSRASPGEAAA